MTEEVVQVQVDLETCHHTLLFFSDASPPMIGDDVWCVRCRHMRKVKRTSVDLYRVRCRRCTFSRRLGNERLTAERRASKHANKYHHPVAVYVGRQLIYVVGESYAQKDTPISGLHLTSAKTSEPPF